MAIERDAGLLLSWPFMGSGGGGFRFFRRGGGGGGGDAQEQIARIDALFDAGAAYLAARAADPSIKTDLRLSALAPTLSGETPVFINATTAEQIESAGDVGRGTRPAAGHRRGARRRAVHGPPPAARRDRGGDERAPHAAPAATSRTRAPTSCRRCSKGPA